MNRRKLERRFRDAVRNSGLVSTMDLAYAIVFQKHALEKAEQRYPLDRILLKFSMLNRDQVDGVYYAIRYYFWRREDKFFLKLATQSQLMNERNVTRCLREQKDLYKKQGLIKRVNEIARRRCYLTKKQEEAVINAMRKCGAVTMSVTEISLEKARQEDSERLSGASARATPQRPESERAPPAPIDVEAPSPPRPTKRADPFEDADDDEAPAFIDDDDIEEPTVTKSARGKPPAKPTPARGPGKFDALRTDDDLDSVLRMDEDDLVDNLARNAKKEAKPAKPAKPEPVKNNRRPDPFVDDDEEDPLAESPLPVPAKSAKTEAKPAAKTTKGGKPTKPAKPTKPEAKPAKSGKGKVLSDDDLDALWEEADIDDIDLDSDARSAPKTPLLDSDDELEDSSSDDLF